MADELLIGKDLEESDRGLFGVVTRRSLGGSEENHKHGQSEWAM
jgi:hypothetical protein